MNHVTQHCCRVQQGSNSYNLKTARASKHTQNQISSQPGSKDLLGVQVLGLVNRSAQTRHLVVDSSKVNLRLGKARVVVMSSPQPTHGAHAVPVQTTGDGTRGGEA